MQSGLHVRRIRWFLDSPQCMAQSLITLERFRCRKTRKGGNLYLCKSHVLSHRIGRLAVLWIVLLIATRKHPWSLSLERTGGQAPASSRCWFGRRGSVCVSGNLSGSLQQRLPRRTSGVPTNLLIAMGISVATAVSAKSIAVKSAAAIAAAPAPLVAPPPSKSGIFSDDFGLPDLGKVQVVLWTAIAVGVFLAEVFAVISCPSCRRIL